MLVKVSKLGEMLLGRFHNNISGQGGLAEFKPYCPIFGLLLLG